MSADNTRSRQVAQFWTSEFGDTYIDRNPATEQAVQMRLRGLAEIWQFLRGDPPLSVLECGCNVGLNLRALRRLAQCELHAIEPNARAREILVADEVIEATRLYDATIESIPLAAQSVDLAFTSGVLIHVPPERLEAACREVHRVSRKYVLALEYFAKMPEAVPYRGQDGLLFKRDFGAFYLDLFPDLVPIAEGFLWQRTTGYDDATWWLFRKRGA